MGRFAGVCDKLGVNSAGHAFVYGFACALVGALVTSLAWRSLSAPNQAPRSITGVRVNSNAGVTGEVAPEVHNTTLNIAEITWWEQLLERAAALRHAKGTGTKNDFPVEQTGFRSY